jgi:hypothetical protein
METRKGDLFEQFKSMSIPELAQYAFSFNITVSNGENEALLIGYLDMERNSDKVVKVLHNEDIDYWTVAETQYVSAENRNWQKA